jgi:hypothetical protein
MDKLDSKSLSDIERFKRWMCERGHVMGVTERVKVKLRAGETTIRYFTTRLLIFQNSVDMGAEIPAEIEVATALDGRILSMVHKCSVPGCGCKREWHPDPEVIGLLAATYLAE